MSIKSNTFNALLHGLPPANTHVFEVIIPRLLPTTFLAKAVTYPSAVRGTVTVPFWGQVLQLPSNVEEASGEWKISLYETSDMLGRFQILKEFLRQENPNERSYFESYLIPIQSNVPIPPLILENCWLKSRNPVSLSMDQPVQYWEWEVSLVFNGINESVPAEFFPGTISAAQVAAIFDLKQAI